MIRRLRNMLFGSARSAFMVIPGVLSENVSQNDLVHSTSVITHHSEHKGANVSQQEIPYPVSNKCISIHHPFLLSDNRHYTFYIWHRFFMVHPHAPLLFAPVYLVSFYSWLIVVGDHQTLLQVLLFPLTLIPLLLPTPLLEPRYFLLPYIFLRTQAPSSTQAVKLEGLWYMAINLATMYVFIYCERPGVGRFMW